MSYLTIIIYITAIILLTQTLIKTGSHLYKRRKQLNGYKETRITLFLVNLFLVIDLIMRLYPQYLHILPGIQTLTLWYTIPRLIIRFLGIYSFYRFLKLFYEDDTK